MIRYLMIAAGAIALAAALMLAAAADIENAQADYVRAVRGPK